MSTHSRKINFALLAILEEQQAKRVWLHPHEIDLIFGIVPNPFLKETLMALYLISGLKMRFCCIFPISYKECRKFCFGNLLYKIIGGF